MSDFPKDKDLRAGSVMAVTVLAAETVDTEPASAIGAAIKGLRMGYANPCALLALEKAVLEETATALRPRVIILHSTDEPDWTDRARAWVAQGGPEELRPARELHPTRRPRALGRVAATLTKIRGRCRV